MVRIGDLTPADAGAIELTLTRGITGQPTLTDTEHVKLVEYQSAMLSRFWGRPITMRAGVVLPPNYGSQTKRTYPGAYEVHGFGGDHTEAWQRADRRVADMREGKQAEMIHIFLDGSSSSGHHEFADSVNNGPWGRALTEEFIPHLERRFRLVRKAYGRLLTGHSSGGWSTLWLQTTYPDFFGGTWTTSPDPVDLRSFTGIDVTPGSTDHAYRERDGSPKQLVRMGGRFIASIEDFARQEAVAGDYGGQLASFEWVWSPRGLDGRPQRLFNRQSGELNQEVLTYWQHYDIRARLERKWETLGPKLRGKVNIFCGDDDTFRLEEAVKMLCAFFERRGSDAVCELVQGRDHFTLHKPHETYPDGLAARIYREMADAFERRGRPRPRVQRNPSTSIRSAAPPGDPSVEHGTSRATDTPSASPGSSITCFVASVAKS